MARLDHPDVLQVDPGGSLVLHARPSTDPDGDALSFRWMVYPDPRDGSVILETPDESRCAVRVADEARGTDMSVVLAVTDDGVPAMTSYRRVTIRVGGSDAE